MASRIARHVLPRVRAGASLTRGNISASAFRAGKRFNSSTSHAGADAGSDRPWQIGSALIFGPLFIYLVAFNGKSSTEHADHHDEKHGDATSEHTETASKEEPEPETEAPPAEEEVTTSEAPAMTDDEGNEASGAELKASIDQAVSTDTPKIGEEAKSAPEDASPAEAEPAQEQKEETSAPASESEEKETASKNEGQTAKEGQAPKQTTEEKTES